MSIIPATRRLATCVCIVLTMPLSGRGQQRSTPEAVGNPLTTEAVLGAPFSADAITIVQEVLGDGTRIERNATARFYRDRAARVRIEQQIMGSDAHVASINPLTRVTVYPDPTTNVVYTLDTAARTAHPGPRGIAALAVGGGSTYAFPLGGARFLIFNRGHRLRGLSLLGEGATEVELLGSRRIEGVECVGRRVTVTLSVGEGGAQPMTVIEERWESPELRLLVYSSSSDPRTGVIEYRLKNVARVEPAADLFEVPPDYRLVTDSSDGSWLGLENAEYPDGTKREAARRRDK